MESAEEDDEACAAVVERDRRQRREVARRSIKSITGLVKQEFFVILVFLGYEN